MKKGPVSLASFFRKSAANSAPKVDVEVEAAMLEEILADEQKHANQIHPNAPPAATEQTAGPSAAAEQPPQAEYSKVVGAAFAEWMLGHLQNPTAFGKSQTQKISQHLGRAQWEAKVAKFLLTLGTDENF